MMTTALLLVHFSDSPHLGGIAVKVWGLVPFGVSEVDLAPVGETVAVSAPMACVACGRRGEGQEGWVWRSPRLLALRRGWGIYGIII
jgi:hypothetical protein